MLITTTVRLGSYHLAAFVFLFLTTTQCRHAGNIFQLYDRRGTTGITFCGWALYELVTLTSDLVTSYGTRYKSTLCKTVIRLSTSLKILWVTFSPSVADGDSGRVDIGLHRFDVRRYTGVKARTKDGAYYYDLFLSQQLMSSYVRSLASSSFN